MENPYTELYKIMGDSTPIEPSFFFGIVKSGLPNLEIETNGIVLDKNNLLIDSNLKISNNANITCSEGTVTHNLKDVIVKGDKVVLVRCGAKFVVISKVVGI